MTMRHHLRIARPVSDLSRSRSMYCAGLGLRVLGSFEDHEGFDGIILGRAGMPYHFEFTTHRTHPVAPRPTEEDLLVLYVPRRKEWERCCGAMRAAGFVRVSSFNPYWDLRGHVFRDPDGYLVVLQRGSWTNREAPRQPKRAPGDRGRVTSGLRPRASRSADLQVRVKMDAHRLPRPIALVAYDSIGTSRHHA
jgi:catechol 2,3-dioxygenase-like lactoylglutathione lyase family enzyme